MEHASRAKKILSIFGTSREAVNMAPVLHELTSLPGIEARTCVTGVRSGLLEETMGVFGLESDYDLEIPCNHGSLFELTTASLGGLREVFLDLRPDMILLEGDSPGSMAAALAAFFMHIPLGHIGAGLRTCDLASPWPEEFNRRMISLAATIHFVPTARARHNLIAERIQPDSIELTGNTSVDAVRAIIARREEFPELRELFSGRKMVLMTLDPAHQSNQDTHQILLCIRELAVHHPEICVVWTMPRHAAIHRQAADLLSHLENIVMIPQMPFPKIVYLTHHCQFVITDSGSMQEYAAALGKPVVLLRERTERPEGIETGGTILTGSAPEKLQLVLETLADLESPAWRRMSDAPNPFGDGNAAVRIANRVWREVTRTEKRLYRTSRV